MGSPTQKLQTQILLCPQSHLTDDLKDGFVRSQAIDGSLCIYILNQSPLEFHLESTSYPSLPLMSAAQIAPESQSEVNKEDAWPPTLVDVALYFFPKDHPVRAW